MTIRIGRRISKTLSARWCPQELGKATIPCAGIGWDGTDGPHHRLGRGREASAMKVRVETHGPDPVGRSGFGMGGAMRPAGHVCAYAWCAAAAPISSADQKTIGIP